jgi:hypothetical protein
VYNSVCSFIDRVGFSWSFNRAVYEWMDPGFVLAEMLVIGIWRYGCGLDYVRLERG